MKTASEEIQESGGGTTIVIGEVPVLAIEATTKSGSPANDTAGHGKLSEADRPDHASF